MADPEVIENELDEQEREMLARAREQLEARGITPQQITKDKEFFEAIVADATEMVAGGLEADVVRDEVVLPAIRKMKVKHTFLDAKGKQDNVSAAAQIMFCIAKKDSPRRVLQCIYGTVFVQFAEEATEKAPARTELPEPLEVAVEVEQALLPEPEEYLAQVWRDWLADFLQKTNLPEVGEYVTVAGRVVYRPFAYLLSFNTSSSGRNFINYPSVVVDDHNASEYIETEEDFSGAEAEVLAELLGSVKVSQKNGITLNADLCSQAYHKLLRESLAGLDGFEGKLFSLQSILLTVVELGFGLSGAPASVALQLLLTKTIGAEELFGLQGPDVLKLSPFWKEPTPRATPPKPPAIAKAVQVEPPTVAELKKPKKAKKAKPQVVELPAANDSESLIPDFMKPAPSPQEQAVAIALEVFNQELAPRLIEEIGLEQLSDEMFRSAVLQALGIPEPALV